MGHILLICGNNHALISEATKEQLTKIAGPSADEFSIESYSESDQQNCEAILREVLSSIQTPSFFGDAKTIWLNDLSAFESEATKSQKSLSKLQDLILELSNSISNFPDDVNLLINSTTIDKRKQLYKAIKESGKIIEHKKPELNSFKWRQEVNKLMRDEASRKNLELTQASIEYLIDAIGVDTGRIAPEMEKICCYAGDSPSLEDVKAVCSGNREAVFYALNEALGNRNLKQAMDSLAQTMSNSKNTDSDSIRLIRMTANYFRKLLHIKIALHVCAAKTGSQLETALQSASPEQKEMLAGNIAFSESAWSLKNLADKAQNYSPYDLREAIELIALVDKSMVSSTASKRTLIETLVMHIISRKHKS
ncbi:MAG: DNA polymerase III subunit delta [Lentisphaeria bacterium]|nr:DNA polymerase III subunit delta [Lentisphaeria bacterium]NQZ67383.1 DNA polymerase III subunit delta [Lentisphaeria bacterium]